MKKAYTVLAVAAWLHIGISPAAVAEVGVEYIGHACFVVASPSGLRVIIDPFNSKRWLGYQFPESVKADAVLVTHPHYDHDASYYWGDSVPVFREPGTYRVGDVRLLGVKGRHADPYGKDFGQANTIWLVETGGARIAHLGDNGPLTEENMRELGRVDVLMIPVDGQEHILKTEEIMALRQGLRPAVTVPMHYRLEGFLGLPRTLGPLGPWLEKQTGVIRLEENKTRFDGFAGEEQVVVFPPSPELKVWPDGLAKGWQKLGQARRLVADDPQSLQQAAALVREAAESADCVVFSFQWARALSQGARSDEAIEVLETVLARAGRDDWEYRMRARSLLAELYRKEDRTEEAAEQYRMVLENTHRLDLREKARRFLDGHAAR
ncbi:MAG: MBL fold metallo-hydrolase [Acidobacteriota bacterium]